MTIWKAAWLAWGRFAYRLAARLAGLLLGQTGSLKAILVHRSVSTGEVLFGRSDLDLVLLLRPEAQHGPQLARLLDQVLWVQRLLPVMLHREVFRLEDLRDFARRDSVWASVERRTLFPVHGESVELPDLPVEPQHATRRLLVWWEVFFSQALSGRSGSSREKAVLECWNFYAVARRLLREPLLLRSEMRAHFESCNRTSGRLSDPEVARRRVLEMFEQLHAESGRPALARLSRPLIFTSVLAPHGTTRRFVILSDSRSGLPGGWRPGDLVATPELLDLFMHVKNAFMLWSLPPELEALGMVAPEPEAWIRDGLYTCSAHFLRVPGFGARVSPHPGVRLENVRVALEGLEKGETPQAPEQPFQALTRDARAYYLAEYDLLEQRRVQLTRRLEALAGSGLDGP